MSTATRSEADTLGCRYFNSDWRLLVVHLHLLAVQLPCATSDNVFLDV